MVAILICLWLAVPALGQTGPVGPSAAERQLAQMYAPQVRMRDRDHGCENGVADQPIDVAALFDNDEVALRGPWDTTNLVAPAPSAQSVAGGLFGYHLDFPGDALRPGCSYREFAARLGDAARPTAYARVVREEGYPNQLGLQYWFFYIFNDWNNTHEGDWEMIQLTFDASSAEEALGQSPVEAVYSQHSSAEWSRWSDDKVQKIDGRRPIVYPAEGPHANFFASELYLMRSQAEGMGCDNTVGPSRSIDPQVVTLPSDNRAAIAAHPWLGFEGRWGEQHAGVFNGPTGPIDKLQWAQPMTWRAEQARDTTFTVPSSRSAVGTQATDLFCGVVESGSVVLRRAKANPGGAILVIGGLALLLLWGLTRTRWRSTGQEGLRERRTWGQLITSSAAIFRQHPRLLMGVGLLFIPLGLLATVVQWLLFRAAAFTPLVDEAGERNPVVATMALGVGILFTLLGLAAVQAATTWALDQIDQGRRVTALQAYRAIIPSLRSLLVALAIAIAIQVVLDSVIFLIPVAIFMLVRWSMLGVVAGAEGAAHSGLLSRSFALTRGNWWRVASIAIGVTGLALAAGPAVGVIALMATGATFDVINLIAAIIHVAALPFSALVMGHLYHDLRLRQAERATRDAASPGSPVAVSGPGHQPTA